MELPPGVLSSKAPIDGGLVGIALPFQGLDFPEERSLVGDAPPEARAGQHAKLNLCHVQPTAVFGCVVELQPFHDAPGLSRGKGLV